MTCFWKAILLNLNEEDSKILNRPKNELDLIKKLKHENRLTSVTWNGLDLTEKEIKENFSAISYYEPTDCKNGYLCSASEPFFFLLSEILECDINHLFCGIKIMYKTTKKPRRTAMRFTSNKTHMSKG